MPKESCFNTNKKIVMFIEHSPNTVEVSDPCFTYVASGRQCLIILTYKRTRYSEYICLGRSSYSIKTKTKMPFVTKQESLEKKRYCLKKEEEEAIIKILRL